MSIKALPARGIYGWDSVNEIWVKVKVDSDGKISIINTDISTILSEIQSATYGLEAIKDAIDAVSVSGASAQEVWEYVGSRALTTPADYKADVSSLALEATFTAIKGAGWSDENIKEIVDYLENVTYGLSALKDLLDALPTLAEIESGDLATILTYHDVPSEDSATDSQMRDVVGKKSDTVAGTSIVSLIKKLIVDTGTDIVADFDRHLVILDSWSDSVATVTITGGSTDVNLPDVIIPSLPTGASIWKVILLFKCAKIKDSSASDNAINGVAAIRIKKSTGAWGTDDIVAYDIQDNSWAVDVSEATEIGGDAFIGNLNNDDLSGEVDAAATYNLRFEDIQADGANLVLHDVAVGLRVYFY